MNDFLRAQYEQSRQTYLENLAYMQQQNEQFAEQNGGADNLSEANQRIYKGREARIIKLVAYHDRAQEYIEDLQDWIGNLIRENRNLSARAAENEQGWKRFFPNMTNANQTESHREHTRQMSIINLQLAHPELF